MYKIRKLDEQAIENAEKKWNSIAKPLHSLGVFEEIIKNIAGIQGTQNIDIKKRCVLVMCADNGVVCEGVTQTGQEVTAVVTSQMVQQACVLWQEISVRTLYRLTWEWRVTLTAW